MKKKDGQSRGLELRELGKKLKSAYMNKERAAQMTEKEALQYEKMKREAEIAHKMKEYERVIKEGSSAELKQNKEKIMYQQELEKQLDEQERKRQDAYEEFPREQLMIDEIVRKNYEEDQMLRKWEEMEEENRKITEFANVQQREDRVAKVRDTEEKKQRLESMLIAQNLKRQQQKRDELEQIRQELLEEQAETERKKEMTRQENICAIVEEERQKLLKEYASKLSGYLPQGIRKDEDDINTLGEEFRLAYQKRRGNTFSEES
ncbi:LOW QUALITY PROTEIN: meiosis-specific nuclear structural protein 1 [Spheniscus humboldti]